MSSECFCDVFLEIYVTSRASRSIERVELNRTVRQGAGQKRDLGPYTPHSSASIGKRGRDRVKAYHTESWVSAPREMTHEWRVMVDRSSESPEAPRLLSPWLGNRSKLTLRRPKTSRLGHLVGLSPNRISKSTGVLRVNLVLADSPHHGVL